MMMIRSQDKKKLYPLTKGIYYDSGVSILMDLGFSVDGNGDLLLGRYESESRCLEILDEIQKAFEDGSHAAINGTGWNYGVYQMPEK